VTTLAAAGCRLREWGGHRAECLVIRSTGHFRVRYRGRLDRAGIGGSEADGHAPTPTHVARKLHALLTSLGVDPPYVLVGHSSGGLLIRMFAAIYPEEVAGLVYVDPTDPRSLEKNLAYLQASGYSADAAREFLEAHRERLSQFVRSQSGVQGRDGSD